MTAFGRPIKMVNKKAHYPEGAELFAELCYKIVAGKLKYTQEMLHRKTYHCNCNPAAEAQQ